VLRCPIPALGKYSPCPDAESDDSKEGGKEVLREDKTVLYVHVRSEEEEYKQKEQKQQGVQDWHSLIANLRGSVKVYTKNRNYYYYYL
jgi:hypothetical protein